MEITLGPLVFHSFQAFTFTVFAWGFIACLMMFAIIAAVRKRGG